MGLISYIDLPKINPIHFVQLSPAQNLRYHLPHFDYEWNELLKQVWQNSVRYYQKIQFNQNVQIQFHVDNGASAVSLELVDCRLNSIATFSAKNILAMPGNIGVKKYRNVTITKTLNTYHYSFSMSDIPGLQAGKYYLKITVSYAGGVNYYCISEPLQVANNFPQTVLLEYYHTTNKRDIFFIQTNALLSLRVEAYIRDFVPFSDDTVYNDEGDNQVLLDSLPYRKSILTVAGNNQRGAPNYIFDKINRAFSCNNVTIDGIPYAKDNGAQWQMQRYDRWQMGIGDLLLREPDNSEGVKLVNTPPLSIYQRDTFPYLLDGVSMSSTVTGGSIILVATGGTIIEDQAAENNLLNTLNGSLSTARGLTGSFYFTPDGWLKYNNGAGEFYDTASGIVRKYMMFLNFSYGSGITATTTINVHNTATTYVDWGGTFVGSYAAGNPRSMSRSITNSTGSTKVYKVRIFHNDNDIFEINLVANNIRCNGFGGLIPATMFDWNISGTIISGNVDLSLLDHCSSSLINFNMNNGSIGIAGTVTIPVNAYPQLLTFNIASQRLSSATVDAIFNWLASAGVDVNGSADTSLQTPSAPPTIASVAARIYLTTTKTWTLTTD